jgi:hypothetical protein
MKLASFDWDAGNWPKCGKHGVSREEIEEVFTGLPAILADPHLTEPRQRAIGQTQAGRFAISSLTQVLFLVPSPQRNIWSI